jgi:hypothetical protein
MKTWMKSAVAILAVMAAARPLAGAQAGDTMAGTKAPDTTYIGCVEAGMAAGRFTLTHVTADMGMHKDAMKQEAMKQDAMKHEAMKHDAMTPATLAIVGQGVDLSKHVGHKVSVTGREAGMSGMEKSDGMSHTPVFSVSSIKMIAASCGM